MSSAYLRSCHRANDSLCPIFRLGDMVREAGENFSKMAVEVGVLIITLLDILGSSHWKTRSRLAPLASRLAPRASLVTRNLLPLSFSSSFVSVKIEILE